MAHVVKDSVKQDHLDSVYADYVEVLREKTFKCGECLALFKTDEEDYSFKGDNFVNVDDESGIYITHYDGTFQYAAHFYSKCPACGNRDWKLRRDYDFAQRLAKKKWFGLF